MIHLLDFGPQGLLKKKLEKIYKSTPLDFISQNKTDELLYQQRIEGNIKLSI